LPLSGTVAEVRPQQHDDAGQGDHYAYRSRAFCARGHGRPEQGNQDTDGDYGDAFIFPHAQMVDPPEVF